MIADIRISKAKIKDGQLIVAELRRLARKIIDDGTTIEVRTAR